MKLITLLFALLLASDCDPAAVQSGPARITVYSPEIDLSSRLAHINSWLAGQAIVIEQIGSDSADATVRLGNVPHNAEAVAFAWSGTIRLRRDSSASDLLHELLHCAGVAHENDPTSIMYLYAQRGMQDTRYIKPHHVEALRRLAGISPAGRIGAQIEVLR